MRNAMIMSIVLCLLVTFEASDVWAAAPPVPTKKDVAYGKHPKQVMHFWQAETKKPTTHLFFIHGGGWQGGDRMNRHLVGMLPRLLEKGISAVSIEYRFIREAVEGGVKPPVKAPLHD
ncbi:MAG: alpha/beta hydrolase, partial [Planctomycetaceae bacterium]|nr:alpha/beta hydrolase [Planctomycetaceae bacterium]